MFYDDGIREAQAQRARWYGDEECADSTHSQEPLYQAQRPTSMSYEVH